MEGETQEGQHLQVLLLVELSLLSFPFSSFSTSLFSQMLYKELCYHWNLENVCIDLKQIISNT